MQNQINPLHCAKNRSKTNFLENQTNPFAVFSTCFRA